MPSERNYLLALSAIHKRGIATSVRAMLGAHLASPNHVATFRSLGHAAGFSQRNSNRVYGQFAGRVRRELGMKKPGIELFAIATGPEAPIDAAEEFSFRLYPAFARALLALDIPVEPPRRSKNVLRAKSQGARADYYEGTIRGSQVTGWERNRAARKACIAHFGVVCQACGFSFKKKYGSLGADFIEVHHATQYAADVGRRRIDPLTDLVPVCSNCHRMLHTQTPCLGLRELRTYLGKRN